MTIILYSIPFFFVLIGLELAVQAASDRTLHRLNDSVADLSCGILSQISGVFTKLLTVAIFIWVGSRWTVQGLATGVPDWPEGMPFAATAALPGFQVRVPELVSWAGVFVLVDLAYYWSHRLSHEINVLWAAGGLPGVAAAGFCVASLAWFLPRRKHLTEDELAPIM